MNAEVLEISNVPALIEGKSLIEAFQPNGLDSLIDKIRAEAREFKGDISTDSGRKEIASFAYKIAKAKSQIEKLGKESIEDLQKTVKAVTAERQRGVAELQKLQDDVRKPLTEFEEAEKSRIAAHEADIERLNKASSDADLYWQALVIDDAVKLLAELENAKYSWEEFQYRGNLAHTNAINGIRSAIDRRKKHDAEQAELVRLRAESAAREQKEREDGIARAAADQAKADAEAKAARELDEQKRKTDEAEAARVAAEEKAKQDAKIAAERAEQEKQAAIQAEKDKQEASRKAEEAEVARREADTKHRGTINRAILAGLIAAGITEEQGKSVIKAILAGIVPNVKINY